MHQLFNNPKGRRGSYEVQLPMHKIYAIVRDRIEYMCMGKQSIDLDAVCQNVCVEIEKEMGIFPNIEKIKEPPKPGTLAYAEMVDADMTDPTPKPGETDEQAKARRDYYRGFDDDGLPSD